MNKQLLVRGQTQEAGKVCGVRGEGEGSNIRLRDKINLTKYNTAANSNNWPVN